MKSLQASDPLRKNSSPVGRQGLAGLLRCTGQALRDGDAVAWVVAGKRQADSHAVWFPGTNAAVNAFRASRPKSSGRR